MPEGRERPTASRQPKLDMGGSLGALPTENLLQMIGNLRLSTRLLLENSETKDYFLLTFREGELVPDIESSHYPTLEKALKKDSSINQTQMSELTGAQADLPFWNRLMVAGLIDRQRLKRYLVNGIQETLKMFHNLSGVHFELSPIPTERLGTLTGYSVTEIVALARKPDSIPEPAPRPEPSQKPAPVKSEIQPKASIDKKAPTPVRSRPQTEKKPPPAVTEPETAVKPVPAPAVYEPVTSKTPSTPSSTPAARSSLTNLLRQLHQIVPGVHACYIIDCQKGEAVASSSSLQLNDRPDFIEISKLICSRTKTDPPALGVQRFYLVTDKYLVGCYFVTPTSALLAICRRQTQFGLLLTGLRRVGQRVTELIKGR